MKRVHCALIVWYKRDFLVTTWANYDFFCGNIDNKEKGITQAHSSISGKRVGKTLS